MIKFDIKSLFKREKKREEAAATQRRKELVGRGIKLLFLVSSCVSENDQKTFKSSLQNSLLKNYFSSVDITYYECEDNSMWFKVFCPEAIFTVKSEDIEPVYRYIFDNAFSFVKSLVDECGYKLQGYSFEFVYRMFAEEPEGIMPIPEEGSILNYEYNLDLEMEEEK